jgi:hypothetical protein
MILATKLILTITFLLTMGALNIFFKLKEDSPLDFTIKRICRDFLIIVALFSFIVIILFSDVQ